MLYSASQRGACEDQAEKPHCPLKMYSYVIAQEQTEQRFCKVICEKGEGEGGKKGEQAQGARHHGNKVLTQKRLKLSVCTGESTRIWGRFTSGICHSGLPFGYCTLSFPLFLGIFSLT